MSADRDAEDAWHDRSLAIVAEFASSLREMDATNPWPERDLLAQAMGHLLTQLWDEGFTQDQINEAVDKALAALPHYVGNKDR